MLEDLIRAVPAALLAGVLPGWFWTTALRDRDPDLAERLAFSTAFSMALVPPAAMLVMWLAGTGVTALVAVAAPLAVFLTGLVVRLRFGPAQVADAHLAAPHPLNPPALLTLATALGLALWTVVASPEVPWATPLVALLVLLAGLLVWHGRQGAQPALQSAASRPNGGFLFPAALMVVLGAILARGYAGPVLYDWPYLRGGDQYNHAVQANGMLSVGHYDEFLVYPPGFSTLTASVSRLSGLEPLEVFPVLAPVLILLPALAGYALAKDLWGRECGLAAAAFAGLLANGTWMNIADARYPNLVSAQFLLVLMVAALVRLYRSPEPRPALTLALLGSSVVLYHSVGSFYAALLLGLIAALFVPYLLIRDRRRGVALLLSLALLGALSVAYAWNTYDLGRLLGGLLTGTETGAGGEAVSIAIGTQPALSLESLPGRVSPAVLWFGLLGLLLLFTPAVGEKDLPGFLSRATLLLWCGVLFIGSRTALSGFPQRFERDLGIPLSVLAALALVAVLISLPAHAPARGSPGRTAALPLSLTAVTAILALSLVGTQAWASLERAAVPAPGDTLTPELAESGKWLKEHNTGGKIVPSPSYGGIPGRGMLALGGYDGLQAYPERRVETPRSLPPGGIREIKDARWLLLHPQSERAREVIERRDVRYVVLSKSHGDPRAFEGGPYRKVFENGAVVIFEPSGSG